MNGAPSALICRLLFCTSARLRTITIVAAASCASAVPATAAEAKRDVAQLWVHLCASCHGLQMEGGRAPSMLDDVWAHGSNDADLARSIREGSEASGMPPFKTALTEEEVRAFVVYIRETHERARNARPARGSARPIEGLRVQSEQHDFRVEIVASGVERPWGFAFLPDARLLVTERPGRLCIIEPGKGIVARIRGLPPVWERQDGGLMDVELHPDYAETGWVYLAFSELDGAARNASTTRIIRGRIRDGAFVDQEDIFRAAPELYWADTSHYGSRFAFDGDGYLYYTIGDRGRLDTPQDLASPYGKTHRIFDDGRVPPDNPFVRQPGAVSSIWSYGHRNQQGMAIHPVTGELWSAEHGPRGGDELNLIQKSRNYGWPVITHGINYDGTPVSDRTEQEGMEQPVVHWTPSIAVCAAAFYFGDAFSRWKNHLFVTALAGQELRRVELDGHTVVRQEVILKGYGRVRDVATGPDGYLYVAINDPGLIVRFVPVDQGP